MSSSRHKRAASAHCSGPSARSPPRCPCCCSGELGPGAAPSGLPSLAHDANTALGARRHTRDAADVERLSERTFELFRGIALKDELQNPIYHNKEKTISQNCRDSCSARACVYARQATPSSGLQNRPGVGLPDRQTAECWSALAGARRPASWAAAHSSPVCLAAFLLLARGGHLAPLTIERAARHWPINALVFIIVVVVVAAAAAAAARLQTAATRPPRACK